MKQAIVGRKQEQQVLKNAFESPNSEFLAITGRRRVGKTYLIRNYFWGQVDFSFTGVLHASYQQQLEQFWVGLQQHFKTRKSMAPPTNWMEAFQLLGKCLQAKKRSRRIVIFIDELPWLDTHKSNFMMSLDWFWNNWATQHNVLLIVCGSATSWIINHLINHHGGLHNRITKRIHLSPFTLHETKAYLRYRQLQLSDYQILLLYMVLGGIPYYLNEVWKGESTFQAVDRICFQKNGLLHNEFNNLYRALFKNSENHEKIIQALASKMRGLTRPELLALTGLSDGGTFTSLLAELEWCDFITAIRPFGKTKKETLYRLQDEYTLFYLKFMRQKKNVNWQQLAATQSWKAWSGFAFENLCIKHVDQIKQALGISGVYSETAGFSLPGTNTQPGTQIDLLIDRKDEVINVCEAKFYDKPFALSKAQALAIKQKIDIFQTHSGSTKSHFATLITTYGITPNQHSIGFIQQVITMDDLLAL